MQQSESLTHVRLLVRQVQLLAVPDMRPQHCSGDVQLPSAGTQLSWLFVVSLKHSSPSQHSDFEVQAVPVALHSARCWQVLSMHSYPAVVHGAVPSVQQG